MSVVDWQVGEPAVLVHPAGSTIFGRILSQDGGRFMILTPDGSKIDAGFAWLRKPTGDQLLELEKWERRAEEQAQVSADYRRISASWEATP